MKHGENGTVGKKKKQKQQQNLNLFFILYAPRPSVHTNKQLYIPFRDNNNCNLYLFSIITTTTSPV